MPSKIGASAVTSRETEMIAAITDEALRLSLMRNNDVVLGCAAIDNQEAFVKMASRHANTSRELAKRGPGFLDDLHHAMQQKRKNGWRRSTI